MTAGVAIDLAAARLRSARRVTVLTGAGVSAASGVPTFRGPDGLWRQYHASDLATPDAFRRDPALVWEWYQWRRARVAACAPNPAHEVLSDWSRRDGWTVITQNVDDLHLRAGTRDLIRLHGSLWELSCWAGCRGSSAHWRDERVPLPERLPSCPACGGVARPAVVWFGESLDPADLDRAMAAAACDVFIAAGTSATVFPAAGLIDHARREGAFTIEINPDATPASAGVDCVIACGAEQALPAIASRLSDR